MTTLPCHDIESLAMKLWSNIEMYVATKQAHPGIEYHIKLAQQALSQVSYQYKFKELKFTNCIYGIEIK